MDTKYEEERVTMYLLVGWFERMFISGIAFVLSLFLLFYIYHVHVHLRFNLFQLWL